MKTIIVKWNRFSRWSLQKYIVYVEKINTVLLTLGDGNLYFTSGEMEA